MVRNSAIEFLTVLTVRDLNYPYVVLRTAAGVFQLARYITG